MDHRCDSLNSVASGISWWLFGWWTHPYPAGHRHRRGTDSSDSRTKVMAAIWTPAGEGEIFGDEVVSRSGKILPKLRTPSVRYIENNLWKKGGI